MEPDRDHLTTKHSTIMIATDGKTRVYQSVEEVPEKLRAKLLDSTHGTNSATILIADKRGRKEILKAMQESRLDRYSKLVTALVDGKAPADPGGKPGWVMTLRLAGRLLLVGGLGYILWVLASLR